MHDDVLAITNWYFDIEEVDNGVTYQYTVGPIALDCTDPGVVLGGDITLRDFVDTVNNVLADAYASYQLGGALSFGRNAPGGARTLYELSVIGYDTNYPPPGTVYTDWPAGAGLLADTDGDGIPNYLDADYNTTHQHVLLQNIGIYIKYKMTAVHKTIQSNFKFKFLWATGPNGTTSINSWPDGPDQFPSADVTYSNKASVKAIELPCCEAKTVMIIDKPPPPPFVDITPYKGINNKLFIFLDGNIGDVWSRPVMIKESDFAAVKNHYTAQHGAFIPNKNVLNLLYALDDDQAQVNALATETIPYVEQGPGMNMLQLATYLPSSFFDGSGNPTGPIAGSIFSGFLRLNYKSDDPPRKYEIYRITTKPNSYADFDTPENPIQVLSTELGTQGKRAVDVAFTDTVAPNVKYYYCFRCVDVHNNFSNPTIVYEAEIVDDEGQIYFILKPFDFDGKVKRKLHKAGRRYIYIEPSIVQAQIQSSAAHSLGTLLGASGGDVNAIQETDLPANNCLGPNSGTKVWDKVFKIRVTSKKTGKKFDLNLTFNNTGVDNP